MIPLPLSRSAILQETWYYMPQGRVIRQDDVTADSLKAKATKTLDDNMFAALTGESGPLPCGALPSVKAATEQGQKAVLEALDDTSKTIVKEKKRKPNPSEAAEPVKPKTLLEWGPQKIWDTQPGSQKNIRFTTQIVGH